MGLSPPADRRLAAGTTERYIPHRARCRACRATPLLASARTFPRRADDAATIGAALLASTSGLGHRRIADQLGLPATTVRGWLRRALANHHEIWSIATRRTLELDPMADPFTPSGHPLVALIGAVGQAIAAHVRRLGPTAEPWSVAVLLTRGRLLAPPTAASARPQPDPT